MVVVMAAAVRLFLVDRHLLLHQQRHLYYYHIPAENTVTIIFFLYKTIINHNNGNIAATVKLPQLRNDRKFTATINNNQFYNWIQSLYTYGKFVWFGNIASLSTNI